MWCVVALSPAVLCTCCCSAFRGYAPGAYEYVTDGQSPQVTENLSKLIIGMGLALFIGSLAIQPADLGDRMMAVEAIAGVSVGSILSVFYLFFNHRRTNRLRPRPLYRPGGQLQGDPGRLLKLAIPITISSSTSAIVTLIDNQPGQRTASECVPEYPGRGAHGHRGRARTL